MFSLCEFLLYFQGSRKRSPSASPVKINDSPNVKKQKFTEEALEDPDNWPDITEDILSDEKRDLAVDIFGSDSVLENTGGTGDCPFTDSSDIEPPDDGEDSNEEEEEEVEKAEFDLGSIDSFGDGDKQEDEDRTNIPEESDEEIPPSPTFKKTPVRAFGRVKKVSQDQEESVQLIEAIKSGLKICDEIELTAGDLSRQKYLEFAKKDTQTS